jgi:vacuolar-type H+-ATPase subunit D/Vma8
MVKETAALMIQTKFRSYRERKTFLRQKHALMKCQANVLTRQFRRAYLEMTGNTNKAQAYIKRLLAMVWYQKIKTQKDTLEHHIEKINDMIG